VKRGGVEPEVFRVVGKKGFFQFSQNSGRILDLEFFFDGAISLE
jgi:hypothetical protein